MTNPLQAIPAQARLYAYAVLALAAIVVAGLQATDGDWLAFAAYVLGALGFSTAGSNINAE